MILDEVKEGGSVSVYLVKDELVFVITEMPKPLTKEEKKALKRAKAELEITQNVEQSETDNS